MTVDPTPVPEGMLPIEGPGIAGPAPTPGVAPTPVPAQVPAPAWPRVGAVLSGSFDAITAARIPLRNGSLYIGLLGLLTIGPAILALVAQIDVLADAGYEALSDWTSLAVIVAGIAIVAINVESGILGVAILGGARVGSPMSVREALRRSRVVFWRVLIASIVVGIIAAVVTQILSAMLDRALGPASDFAAIGASILAGVVMAPFAYTDTGIILGDVGAFESIRRSLRLARARFRLAVLVSVFAIVAQYLLILAALTALDLVFRALQPFSSELEAVDVQSAGGSLLLLAVSLVALFAWWTLSFSVGALASAPQVVAFLGLTGYSGGLDAARDAAEGGPPRPDPAWLTRPMIAGIVVALVSAAIAMVSGGT